MTSINRELLKGSVDLVLLTLLEQEPMYGYQIVKTVKEASNDVIVLKEGSLYPALHRLERAGFVTSRWQVREDGTNRRYYQLTEAGYAAVHERQSEWQRFITAMEGVLRYA